MKELTESELVSSGAMPPSSFHDSIERLREIAQFDLEVPIDLDARLKIALDGLVVGEEVLRAALAALRVGHLVLQGPPGTGKSAFVRALAKAFNVTTYAVTAHEDWTIYDVIGRLELRLSNDRKEEIIPVNGAFTEAVIRCGNNVVRHFDDPAHPQGEWLLIDELNRAHMDKAFGELFSILGTDDFVPINLPHQKAGNRELVVPRRFRIVATLNSYDKQFVQALSQAIRRRFTFISLDIPPKRPDGMTWTFNETHAHAAMREFTQVIRRAAWRCARRDTSGDNDQRQKREEELIKALTTDHLPVMSALFDFVERVRYATSDSGTPHLPIGTAQLVDTVELFITRNQQDGGDAKAASRQVDWAASVKLAPLFEADLISPELVEAFAQSLSAPFDVAMKTELLVMASSGVHFVPRV